MKCSPLWLMCGFLLILAIRADFPTETISNDYEQNISKLIFEFIINYKRLKFGIMFTCTRRLDFERPLNFHGVAKLLMEGNVSFRAINIDGYGIDDNIDGYVLNVNRDGNKAVISGGKYAKLLRELITHRQFVLLDLKCVNANVVMEQASRYELFNASFHWLIIDEKLDINDTAVTTGETAAKAAAADPERWTTMYRLQSEQSISRRRGTGRQHNCLSENSTKRGSPVTDHLNPHGNNGSSINGDDYYDTGVGDGDGKDDTFGQFETINISINAEITLVKATNASYRSFALFDIWNPGFINGGRLNVTAMGNFIVDSDGSGRLVVRFRESTVVRRRDMNGLQLKIMTVVTQKPHEPFEAYLSTPKNTHLDSVHRYNFGLMCYLRDYFNFSFIMSRTKSWGYLRNGTFDGMIGALSRREVDLGGSPMFFRQERHRVVSYTTRSFIERPCFIFRHPKRQNTMRNPFLLPFETVIWYLMMICGAILALVLFTGFHFEDSGIVRGGKTSIPANKFSESFPPGPLKMGNDKDDDESYYGDSFRLNRSIEKRHPGLGLMQPHWQGTKDNVLFNDRNKNNDDDPHCQLRLGCHPLGRVKTLSRRHISIQHQHQQQLQQRKAFRKDDATANNNSYDSEIGMDEKVATNMMRQGLSEIPHLPSGKCTSLFILLFGYLMFQYYSASIVGSLLMAPPKTIKTLRHLIDSRLTLGIEDIPYSRDYFVRTTDEDSLELFRSRISFYNAKTSQNESHFLNAADGLGLVKAGGYAFHVAISAGYKIIRESFNEREVCELTEIDMFPTSTQWMVAIVQKNSPYRDVITYGLRRLNEAGIMDHQRRVWQEPKPKCARKIAPTDLIVGMDSVYSAFILLLAGLLLSGGLLLIELLHHQLGLARIRWQRILQQQERNRRLGLGNLPQQPRDHDLVYPYVD